MESKKPIKIYKSRGIKLSVWSNKFENKEKTTFTFQKSYKNDQEDIWKNTNVFSTNDLPILKVLINKAYNEQILK